MADREFAVTLDLKDGYRFDVDFLQDGVPGLVMDEPDPLGAGAGPNAVRVLGAAIGNCLGASLLFCLRRSHIEVASLRVDVSGTVVRNEAGRYRVGEVHVKLHPDVAPGDMALMSRCLDLFEDFCIVTQSVRDGIAVQVEVASPAPAA